MCSISDVYYSSYHSAPEMTSTLFLYGNGDMGKGIRRVHDEQFFNGLAVGSKTGFIKGTAVTLATILVVDFSIRLIKKVAEDYKLKKEAEQEEMSAAS